MIQIPIERREEAIPEGYVKVVRCGECKHYKYDDFFFVNYCERFDMVPADENFYCAFGERKEETEIETPDATFYCQETPEEIIQKIAEAEKCERGCIDDRKDEVDDFLSEIMKW